jgi:hypothetical protein
MVVEMVSAVTGRLICFRVSVPRSTQFDCAASAQFFCHCARENYSSRLCACLQTRSQIHSLTKDVVGFNNNIGEFEAHPQQDQGCVRLARCPCEIFLYANGTPGHVKDIVEGGKEPVASVFDNATALGLFT